jgi:hypothetical protein
MLDQQMHTNLESAVNMLRVENWSSKLSCAIVSRNYVLPPKLSAHHSTHRFLTKYKNCCITTSGFSCSCHHLLHVLRGQCQEEQSASNSKNRKDAALNIAVLLWEGQASAYSCSWNAPAPAFADLIGKTLGRVAFGGGSLRTHLC